MRICQGEINGTAKESVDMKRLLLFPAGIFLILMLLACSATPVLLDRVIVQNATSSNITNVKVRHEPTNKFGAVNTILPQKALDIGFPEQSMRADRAVVSWRDGAGRDWTVAVPLPHDQSAAKEGQPLSLVYIIYPSGQVSVALQAGATR